MKLPDAEKLYELYIEKGLSQKDIAERYGVSAPAVSLALKRAKISNGRRAKESKETSRNKSRARLQALASGKLDKYGQVAHKFNRQFFDEWIPEMAYVLGLVFADGHVGQRGSLRFQYGVKDKAVLDNIAYLMEYTEPLTEINNNGYPSWRIVLTSRSMCERLHELGVPEGKKAKTIRFPAMPVVLQRHFVRGFFDGDGCATYGQIKFSSSSLSFLEDIHCVITDHIGPNGGKIYRYKGRRNRFPQGTTIEIAESGTLTYCAIADREAIFQLLYSEVTGGQFSERKRQDFENKGLQLNPWRR